MENNEPRTDREYQLEQQKQQLEKAGNFTVEPVTEPPAGGTGLVNLNLGSADRMRMSALLHELLPAASMIGQGQLYRVQFPEGLPNTLMRLTRQPGYSSTVIGENGKIAGTASLLPAGGLGTVQLAFQVMSIATSQYYLNEINSQMELMNSKLDQILEFLYGEKMAELLANQTFVRYAASNYASIMNSDVQREATIGSLQQARIIAMKDIEFYLNDLDKEIRKNPNFYDDIRKSISSISQTYENLSLSEQLFVMSSLMEMYYSQNMDPSYLDYIEAETTAYLARCDKRILMDVSNFIGKAQSFKSKNPFDKALSEAELAPLRTISEKTYNPEQSQLKRAFQSSLDEVRGNVEYYLDTNGTAYLRQIPSRR